ncbi:hypothetical protein EJB05_29307, partial [Eragrostis curvula]
MFSVFLAMNGGVGGSGARGTPREHMIRHVIVACSVFLAMNGGVGDSGASGALRELQLQLHLAPPGERIEADEGHVSDSSLPISCVSSDKSPASSRSVLVVGGCSRCMQYFMVPKRDFPICKNCEHPTLFDPLDGISTGGMVGDKMPTRLIVECLNLIRHVIVACSVFLAMNGGVGGSGARGAPRELQLQLRPAPPGERIEADEGHDSDSSLPISCVSSDNSPASSRSVLVVGGCSRCMQYFMVPKRGFPTYKNREHPTLFDPLDCISTGGMAGDKMPTRVSEKHEREKKIHYLCFHSWSHNQHERWFFVSSLRTSLS